MSKITSTDDWTEEAEIAIRLCENWASRLPTEASGQLYLFGSAIYKGGEQFDPIVSDLDIVFIFPNVADALTRVKSLLSLRTHKQALELEMLPALARVTCDEPGVSIVPITELELVANIHKSGARSFFDKNIFYDLQTHKQEFGIATAGTRLLADDARQAIEYVQKTRNEFLSVCANGTGGLETYIGSEPLPKPLLRCAAQLIPDSEVGEWYDTRLGLEFLFSRLSDKRTDAPEYKRLFDKTSVRRGGRGRKAGLSDVDQLLLAEILFDAASEAKTEPFVTWEIRLGGAGPDVEDLSRFFTLLKRFVPDAKLISSRYGSVILRIQSSLYGYKLVESLNRSPALAEFLETDVISLQIIEPGEESAMPDDGGHLAPILEIVSRWQPPVRRSISSDEEALERHLASAFETDRRLTDATIYRNVRTSDIQPVELDFLLSWMRQDGTYERIAIDLVRLNSRATFFNRIEKMRPLKQPVILLLVGKPNVVEDLRKDVSRYEHLSGNVHVVFISVES